MKIVVVGGTGLIGSRVVALLREQGHEAVPASPDSGVNSVTGEGLAQALSGAAVVVDVSNSPSLEAEPAMQFFVTSTQNLLSAGAAARVRHHVALSVVGTERLLESGYFRAKQAQERLIQEGPIPFSIVRATQFFEFVDTIARVSTVGDAVRLPPVLIQPVAAVDVARTVASVAVGAPLNRIQEIAGPDQLRVDALVRRGMLAHGDRREVVADPQATLFGMHLKERSLLPERNARLAATTFEQWLSRQAA